MSLDTVAGLRCTLCSRRYHATDPRFTCEDCGLAGTLDVLYDHDRIAAGWTKQALAADPDLRMWRWLPLLPVDPALPYPPLTVGSTPTYDAPRLAAAVGVRRVWVKDEGRLPTASLKDRASAMAVVKAAERDAKVISTASSGNAAAALAGMCTASGTKAVIFVPASAPQAKVTQLLAYGATVVLVDGSYDDAYDLSMEAIETHGWYNRNTGINPYMTEGKKTVALELCEQLRWEPPDAVVVSVGDGCIIGAVHAGLRDLHALGWIDRIPRLVGAQAAGSDFLVQAFEDDENVVAKPAIVAETVADSIGVNLPRDRVKAMRAVRETGGAFLRVSDDDILAAIPELARGCGVFAEPAAAAGYAGLVAAAEGGLIGSDDTVAVISTGSGLKDVAAAMKAVTAAGAAPIEIPPEMEALEEGLKEREVLPR